MRREAAVAAALLLAGGLACGHYGKPARSDRPSGERYVPLPEPESFRAPAGEEGPESFRAPAEGSEPESFRAPAEGSEPERGEVGPDGA